jgi:hypothetical protein
MSKNPSSSSNASSRFEAVLAEIIRGEEEGRNIDVERYCRSFPEFAEQLRDYFRNRSHFVRKARALAPTASGRTEQPSLPDLGPGSQFACYEILREMGRGGMGVVYLARQQKANRLVALKLIRKDRLEHLNQEQRRQWLTRFCTEAQAAGHEGAGAGVAPPCTRLASNTAMGHEGAGAGVAPPCTRLASNSAARRARRLSGRPRSVLRGESVKRWYDK